MIDVQGPYRIGALFVLVSALLHFLAPVLGGFDVRALSLMPVGALYLVVVYGLLRGWRWLAYLAFLGLFVGGIMAMAYVWTPHPVPSWMFIAIIAADWCAALALFAALWRSAPSNPDQDA